MGAATGFIPYVIQLLVGKSVKKFLALITLCCCLSISAAAREASELREYCAGTKAGIESTPERQKAVCLAMMRRAVDENIKQIFSYQAVERMADFLAARPDLLRPGVTHTDAVLALLSHWERAAEPGLSIDAKRLVGQGLVGAGAALLVGLIIMIPRWIWIGIRSDLRRRRERKADGVRKV